MEDKRSWFLRLVTRNETVFEAFRLIVKIGMFAGLIFVASRIWVENGWFSATMIVVILLNTIIKFKVKK